MFDRILIAVDGSEHSRSVVTRIVELAVASKSEVRVLNVHEVVWAGRAAPVADADETKEAADLVAAVVGQFASAGVSASGAVRQSISGRVAAQIVEEAGEWRASAIALGTRGRTDLEGVFTGSVCHRVLHLSKLPVLVIT
jgi:nucleotide-binding universal stress UspA family protein